MSISTSALKNQASELGFVLCGVTACAEPGRLQQFHAWIDAGFAGQMHYLSDRRAAYADPNSILNGCRSIVMLALPYGASDSGGSQQVSDNLAGM